MRALSLVLLCLHASLAYGEDIFSIAVEGWQGQLVEYKKTPTPLETHQILRTYKSKVLEEEFEVALNIQNPQKPLVVLVPGTFGGYDSSEIMSLGIWLRDAGYNLVRLPNPMSSHIIKLHPSYKGLETEAEAQLAVGVIESLMKEYKFPKTHLIGVSYGAFVTAIAAQQIDPALIGKVVLISPPKNLKTSLSIIDGYFDELKNELTVFPWRHLILVLRIRWNTFWEHKMTVDPQIAKSLLIASGFYRGFVDLVRLHEQPRSTGSWWKDWLRSCQQTRKSSINNEDMRFISYIQRENPTFFEHPEKHEVLYWLRRSGHPWHVYTSSDDFINPPQVWPASSDITVYSRGGHVFGFFDQAVFKNSLIGFLSGTAP